MAIPLRHGFVNELERMGPTFVKLGQVLSSRVDLLPERYIKALCRLVLAALIVGAALLMQVDTTFRILGYPGLAMLCFIAAATGGFWLVVSIFINDQRHRRKMRDRYGK